jgi:hypothetical protein
MAYEELEEAVNRLDGLQRAISDLTVMLPLVQGGAATRITVAGAVNMAPLTNNAAEGVITQQLTRLTNQATALKAKLDAALAAVQ